MSNTHFRFAVTALALLALAGLLPAQSIRPSNGSRASTTRSSNLRSTTGSRTGSQGYGSGGSGATRQYPSNTLLGDAIIQIDPESRSLIVVTDEETHAEITKVIERLDHPKPQVLIKVVFIEVSLDKNVDVGVEGSYTFDIKNGGTTGTGSIQSLFGLAKETNGTFARVASDHWSATLRALHEHGNLHVLSRPTIMARNNQEAVIVVGQEVPFVTNSQITNLGQTINTIQYQDVGIILRVTPFISADQSVEMIVAPEISAISDKTIPISANVTAPVINKRSAETVVVTPNGTTVVIGGLMDKQETSTVQKVPLLGDIPVLGFPFRRTVKSETRRELLIFLTPYIVDSPKTLRTLTECAVNPEDLARNGFPVDTILDDLESFTLPCPTDPKTVPPPAPAPAPVSTSKSAKKTSKANAGK